ncbi:MAG TPA: hypothetical protein DCL21_07335 [Alphaproteobacteria bacterium]|nr:hypothetical protein [Alphaproteobacteria bacterium]
MNKYTFNAKSILNLELPEKGYRLYKYEEDSSLCLKATSKGTKTFIVVLQDGNRRSVGRYPKVKLTKAWDKAKRIRLNFADGVDINEDNEGVNQVEELKRPKLFDMAVKYMAWSVNHKKELSIKSDSERLKNHILPALGNKYVDDINIRDISSFLDSLINKTTKYARLKTINSVSLKSFKNEDFIKVLKHFYVDTDILDINFEELKEPVDIILANYINQEDLDSYISANGEFYYITRTTTQGTANKCKALISHMYNTAMLWSEPEWECVKTNPCVGLKAGKTRSKTRYLDQKELDALDDVLSQDKYINNTVANLIKFLIKTGARRSEAVNARWEHIDFNNKIWRKPDSNSKTKLAPPVPLSTSAINILKHIKSYSGSTGYVFKSSLDESKPVGEFRKSFTRIMKEAGIENCTPHDLRRTFGTQLLLKGVDIFTVSKLLGHNSVATTEKHYAFLNIETLHNAVNLLDDIL